MPLSLPSSGAKVSKRAIIIVQLHILTTFLSSLEFITRRPARSATWVVESSSRGEKIPEEDPPLAIRGYQESRSLARSRRPEVRAEDAFTHPRRANGKLRFLESLVECGDDSRNCDRRTERDRGAIPSTRRRCALRKRLRDLGGSRYR